MRTERKRFIVATLASAGVLVSAAWGAARLDERATAIARASAEREVIAGLARAQHALTSDAPLESRIAAARAASAGATAAAGTVRRRDSLASIVRFIGVSDEPPGISAALAARVRATDDALAWSQDAVPALRRISGYDARADIDAATDARDVAARTYLAREGFRRALGAISDAPVTLRTDALSAAVENTQRAFDATEPLIIALTEGGPVSAHTERFIRYAKAAAADAATALAELSRGQWISAQ